MILHLIHFLTLITDIQFPFYYLICLWRNQSPFCKK